MQHGRACSVFLFKALNSRTHQSR